jgi:hypothetical protein
MHRLLASIGLMGLLLAACTANNAGASATTSTGPLIGPSESMALVSPSAVAMACTDAFATINASAITSLTDAADKLDATIQACPTKDDWVNAIKTALPNVDVTTAEDFLKTRCTTNTQLSATPICTSLGS